MSKSIAVEVIATRILEIRSRKVMLDRDLAKLYGVETKYLSRQVRRNIKRFPRDCVVSAILERGRIFKVTDCDLKNYKTRRV